MDRHINADKGNIVMWQFAVASGLSHFYGKICGYVVIYKGKDKNAAQGNLAELAGSEAAEKESGHR